MSRPSWVQQVYGYAVCLVAIITLLVSASNIVDALFLKMDPLQASAQRYGPEENFSSFEAWRAARQQNPRTAPSPDGKLVLADTGTTAQQRTTYEALRADRLQRASYEGSQKLVKFGILILLSVALFMWHWRWLRGKEEPLRD